jgi:hypothetical protein
MILYELRCGAGHGFEAWFRNSGAYDQQHADSQVACPICGSNDVAKAPMAPRIGRMARGEREQAALPAPAVEQGAVESPKPVDPRHEQMKMVLSKIAELNRHIAETCDYVGRSFPEEARKIHYGEAEHREIYGEASPAEAEELREEGIKIAQVPWLRRGDS